MLLLESVVKDNDILPVASPGSLGTSRTSLEKGTKKRKFINSWLESLQGVSHAATGILLEPCKPKKVEQSLV